MKTKAVGPFHDKIGARLRAGWPGRRRRLDPCGSRVLKIVGAKLAQPGGEGGIGDARLGGELALRQFAGVVLLEQSLDRIGIGHSPIFPQIGRPRQMGWLNAYKETATQAKPPSSLRSDYGVAWNDPGTDVRLKT